MLWWWKGLHMGIICYTPGDSELYVMMMEGITHGDHMLHSWVFWALCYDEGRDYTWGSYVTLLGILSSMLWWWKGLHMGIMCYTLGDSELYVMMMEGITHGDHVLHSWVFWALCYDDWRDYTQTLPVALGMRKHSHCSSNGTAPRYYIL